MSFAFSFGEACLKNVAEAALVRDAKDRIVYMNPVAEELSGWTLARAHGKSSRDVFPEMDESQPAITPLYEGERLVGTVVVFQLDRASFTASATDEQERYRGLFENMESAAALHEIVLDDEGRPVDYVFLEVNKAFEEMTGLKGEEVVGRRVTEALPGAEADWANWIERFGRVALEGESIRIESHSTVLGKWYSGVAYRPAMGQFVTLFFDITECKKREEERRADEERMGLFFQRQIVGMAITSPDKEWMQVNRKLCEMLGYSESELQQLTWAELTHPDDLARDVEQFGRLLSGEIDDYAMEKRFIRKDGTIVHANLSVGCVRKKDGAVDYVLALLEDITKRKKTEAELLASEAKLSTLYAAMTEMVVIHELVFDEQGQAVDYRITDCNDAFARITGISREDAVGKLGSEVYGVSPPPYFDEYRRVAATGESLEFTTCHALMDKHFIISAVSLGADQFATITTEITELKRAEEEVRRSEENFRQIAENIREVFWIGSPDWNKVYYVSPTYEKIWGRPCESLSHEPLSWLESLPPEDRKLIQDWLDARNAGKHQDWVFPEYRVLQPDGSVRWILARAYPIRDDNGRIIRVAGIAEDVTERKQAEEALRISEERFSRAFKSSPDTIAITRLDDGLIIDVNQAFEEMFGVTQDDAVGRTVLELGLHADPSKRVQLIAAIEAAGGSYRDVEYRWRRASGEEFDSLMSGEIIEIGGEKCVISTVRDITERKQAEEALRASEERFSKAFHSSPDAIVITRLSDGLLADVNESFESVFKIAREEAIGRTMLELGLYASPDDRQCFADRLREHGSIRDMEVQFRRAAGDTFDGLLSGEVLEISGEKCTLAIMRDITECKRIERELQEHREHLEELVEQRTEDLRKTLSNLEAAQNQIIQSKKLAFLGRLAAGIAHEVNNPLGAIASAGRMMDQSALKLAEAAKEPLLRNIDEHRQLVDELLDIAAHATDHGYGTRQRRAMRNELMSLFESRQVAAPRSVADTLIDLGISERAEHFLPLLESDDAANALRLAGTLASIHRGAAIIDNAAGRAGKIVYSLRSYSHPGTGQLVSRVDVARGIEDVLILYRNKMKDMHVERAFAKDVSLIEAYPDELYQAWTNLIHNALEAMSYHGTLKLATDCNGTHVTVSIADNGHGMAAEVQRQIFEPFFTTKPAGEGCGIGLDIVKRIVERHHGEISVESAPGVGTSFIVRLPIKQPVFENRD